MKTKRVLYTSLILLIVALMMANGVLAGSVTTGGITLTWPNYPLSGPALQSCEPWNEPSANTIRLDGLPAGATVEVTFVYSNPYVGSPIYLPAVQYPNVAGGSLVIPVVYPMNTANWPVFNTTTNERAIAIAALVKVTSGGTTTKLVSKQWWVRCVPPHAPFQGCTPGYWRQDQHFDSWVPTGLSPSDDYNTVFGVTASFNPHTLLDAVWLGGGGEFALARHAVAALLDALTPGLNYQYTAAQIIAGVQNAYATGDFETFKSALDFANNASGGCPLN